MTEEALFRACLLLIPSRTANGSVEFVLTDRIQQGSGLQLVAAGIETRFFLCPPLIYTFLYRADDEVSAEFPYECITIIQRFLKIVSCINM